MYSTNGLEISGLEINENQSNTRIKDKTHNELDINSHYKYRRNATYLIEQHEISVLFLFNEPCGDE